LRLEYRTLEDEQEVLVGTHDIRQQVTVPAERETSAICMSQPDL
jgi:hypothetical protein